MRTFLLLIAIVSLASCGDSDPEVATSVALPTVAETSDITFDVSEAGVTPFISIVHLVGQRLPAVRSISYVIEPKPGSVSRPVRVSYTLKALKDRGRLVTNRLLLLPVFGLYAGYPNAVSIDLHFGDGSTQTIPLTLTTAAYADPFGIYDRPLILKARAPGNALGFDFFVMKSFFETPVIVDTDGEMRWAGAGITSSLSSIFSDNGFFIGDPNSVNAYRLELDGTVNAVAVTPSDYIRFHHNIDPGKTGYLAEMDRATGIESTITEFAPTGELIKEWNFATLLGDYMRSQGDDPSAFIRPANDWFHSNAATYDRRDNTLLVSSRENFVIKVDYETGALLWVLGDPTKYWYTYPSLRAKALTMTGTGLYPIGQHALSITSDGLLLLFNDGFGSAQQPAGAPQGETRTYSAVSAYSIDPVNKTATEVWNFDYGKSIYSSICSSAYESADHSVLVSYAFADRGTHARLVGLDPEHRVLFDFQYNNFGSCDASWNAVPVPFENMSFQ